MKITIENTEQLVDVVVRGVSVPARLWVGETESGIKVQVLVTRIAVPLGDNQVQFQKELSETAAPTPADQSFPLRLIL